MGREKWGRGLDKGREGTDADAAIRASTVDLGISEIVLKDGFVPRHELFVFPLFFRFFFFFQTTRHVLVCCEFLMRELLGSSGSCLLTTESRWTLETRLRMEEIMLTLHREGEICGAERKGLLQYRMLSGGVYCSSYEVGSHLVQLVCRLTLTQTLPRPYKVFDII